jgi:hypothetical protein
MVSAQVSGLVFPLVAGLFQQVWRSVSEVDIAIHRWFLLKLNWTRDRQVRRAVLGLIQ